MDSVNQNTNVVVKTNARLHMGFLDLNGSQGRRFGSLGLSLSAPNTMIELAKGKLAFADNDVSGYVLKSKQAILDYLNIEDDVSIRVHEQIPRHSGLGSGTQMALAIGVGLCKLFNRDLSLQQIALIVSRGLRSGIGIGTFAQGGLVLDAGRNQHTQVPPIIARHDFPLDWPILLIFDRQHIGVHGQEEVQAFNSLPDSPLAETEKNVHQVLLKALPAVLERDLNVFGDAIAQLQAYTGDYFSPVQGGRYASKQVTAVLNYLTEQGVHAVGQSSWGPTGFAVFEHRQAANQYLQELKQRFDGAGLDWLICSACNQGATVKVGNKP
jgi:beta-RFAP synthase